MDWIIIAAYCKKHFTKLLQVGAWSPCASPNLNQLHKPPVSQGMNVNDVNVNYLLLFSSFNNMSHWDFLYFLEVRNVFIIKYYQSFIMLLTWQHFKASVHLNNLTCNGFLAFLLLQFRWAWALCASCFWFHLYYSEQDGVFDFSVLNFQDLCPISRFVPLSRYAISLLVLFTIGDVVETSMAAI